jgi:hypothetical protein
VLGSYPSAGCSRTALLQVPAHIFEGAVPPEARRSIGPRARSRGQYGDSETAFVVILAAVAQSQMLYYNQAEQLRPWQELERLPDCESHVTIKPHPRFVASIATGSPALPLSRRERGRGEGATEGGA